MAGRDNLPLIRGEAEIRMAVQERFRLVRELQEFCGLFIEAVRVLFVPGVDDAGEDRVGVISNRLSSEVDQVDGVAFTSLKVRGSGSEQCHRLLEGIDVIILVKGSPG